MTSFGWTEEQDLMLKRLVREGQKFNVEIAKLMGKRPASITWRIKKLKLTPSRKRPCAKRMGQWNVKHKHLRLPALKYYQTHSAEETAKRFGLTAREFKSLLTVSYKRADWKKWRKETRTHEAWSAKELQFLLQHAGLRPRKWIMAKLKRGTNVCHIKERMQALGIASRNLQGLTLSQFTQAFGRRPEFYLETDAGPNRGSGSHGMAAIHWRIVPWVWLDQELRAKRLKTSREMRLLISTQSLFQEWIFEGNALRKMKRIVREIA